MERRGGASEGRQGSGGAHSHHSGLQQNAGESGSGGGSHQHAVYNPQAYQVQ
jgi:hypothetical protein